MVGSAVGLPAAMYFAEVATHPPGTDRFKRRLALTGTGRCCCCSPRRCRSPRPAGRPPRDDLLRRLPPLAGYLVFRSAMQASWRERASCLVGFVLAGVAPGTGGGSDSSVYRIPAQQPDAGRAFRCPWLLQASRSTSRPTCSPVCWATRPRHTTRSPTTTRKAAGCYLGIIVLFLAGIGAATIPLHRSPRALFLFACAASFWLVYVYDLGGLGKWNHRIPPFTLGVITRTHIIWTFSVSCLAAIGFHDLAIGTLQLPRRLPARTWRLPVVPALLLGWGLALLFLALRGPSRSWRS